MFFFLFLLHFRLFFFLLLQLLFLLHFQLLHQLLFFLPLRLLFLLHFQLPFFLLPQLLFSLHFQLPFFLLLQLLFSLLLFLLITYLHLSLQILFHCKNPVPVIVRIYVLLFLFCLFPEEQFLLLGFL